MIDNLYDCYKMVQENHICFIYNGPIWADGVEGIGQTLRKRLEFEELPVVTAHSVFSIFFTTLQTKNFCLMKPRGNNFRLLPACLCWEFGTSSITYNAVIK